MGLLKVGKPLSWEESAPHRKYVKEHGVIQFLNTYNRVKDTSRRELLWGDELEYGVFVVDHDAKTVNLSLRGAELLQELQEKEQQTLHRCEGCTWHPEYGSWMVEATPRTPFSGYASDLLRVERNMRLRRKRVLSVLAPNEIIPTVTCLPTMGVGSFTQPPLPPGGSVSLSSYLPDGVINPHPRFAALTANIRSRRGSKVDIRVPLFRDVDTPEFACIPGAPSPSIQSPQVAKKELPPVVDITPPVPPTPAEEFTGGFVWQMDEEQPPKPPATDKAPRSASGTPTRNGRLIVELPVSTNEEGSTEGESESQEEEKPSDESEPCVDMDAMGFGMGCCCLQVTFQARDIDESRFMYDQLAIFSPIMLALSAATPALRGRLVNTDVRWDVISKSVDCRTPAERGEEGADTTPQPFMSGGGVRRLPKSRYDSISTYLHYCKRRKDNPMAVLEMYNDIPCPVDEATHVYLLENGVDPALALHIGHLFTRDPLVIFEGAIEEVDDETETDHFENIQSTNWQTVRWKPPPPANGMDEPIGWRTEFRSMEVQLTDAENAALTVFVVLVTRVILAFDLNLYIPLSKVDENMKRAHQRKAVSTQKFWWRKHMAPPDDVKCKGGGDAAAAGDKSASPPDSHEQSHNLCHAGGSKASENCEEMTVAEIMMGKGSYYPGLIPLVFAYLDHIGCDRETLEKCQQYCELIRLRARGDLPTAATWMRAFIRSHKDYKKDSHVPASVATDLMMACKDIGEGRRPCPELLGNLPVRRVEPESGYDVPLASERVQDDTRKELIAKYAHRSEWDENGLRRPSTVINIPNGLAAPLSDEKTRPSSFDQRFLNRLRNEREPSISLY